MKTIKIIFLLIISIPFVQCSEETKKADKNKGFVQEHDIEITESPEVFDTVPVTIVLLKVMGKETMIQDYYKAGQSAEDYIKLSDEDSDFQKLVNVNVKGSVF